MKKTIIASCLALTIFVESVALANMTLKAKCINDTGKMSKCMVENKEGDLIITYQDVKKAHLNKTITGKQIDRITGGEYAKRRVGTAVALGILVAPAGLFMLFSKKKIENFGIEYKTEAGNSESFFIQTNKKQSFAMKALLQSASGKEIEYPEVEKKSKKK